jgi:hypothetical protein
MKLYLTGVMMLLAGCSSTGSSGGPGLDAQAAAAFCADLGACNSEPSCNSGVCCDGRDCTSECVVVAKRLRADLMPQLEGCLASCGNEDCPFLVEDQNDDRPIDAAFEQACMAAFACDQPPEGYPELCAATGLFTEEVLRAAMDCLAQGCNQGRCLADATFCHRNSPNDFCL